MSHSLVFHFSFRFVSRQNSRHAEREVRFRSLSLQSVCIQTLSRADGICTTGRWKNHESGGIRCYTREKRLSKNIYKLHTREEISESKKKINSQIISEEEAKENYWKKKKNYSTERYQYLIVNHCSQKFIHKLLSRVERVRFIRRMVEKNINKIILSL